MRSEGSIDGWGTRPRRRRAVGHLGRSWHGGSLGRGVSSVLDQPWYGFHHTSCCAGIRSPDCRSTRNHSAVDGVLSTDGLVQVLQRHAIRRRAAGVYRGVLAATR